MNISPEPKAIILMSHLGRPDGHVNPKFSLRPVADELSQCLWNILLCYGYYIYLIYICIFLHAVLNRPVAFLPDCVGPETEKFCENPEGAQVYVLL